MAVFLRYFESSKTEKSNTETKYVRNRTQQWSRSGEFARFYIRRLLRSLVFLVRRATADFSDFTLNDNYFAQFKRRWDAIATGTTIFHPEINSI